MNEEVIREFVNNERKQIIKELSGQGRYQITACRLMADGDRLVTVVDHTTEKKVPTTYVYSKIPYTDDDDIQDFFIRHKRLIEEGIYEEE